MNKITHVLTAAVMCFTLSSFAAETTAEKAEPGKTAEVQKPAVKKEVNTSWTPFQLVFFPGFPAGSKTSNVHGLKLGVPASGGNGCIVGFEASFFYSGTSFKSPGSYVKGIQASWFGPSLAEDVYGLQAAQSYAYARSITGVQAGPLIFVKEYSCGVQAAGGGIALNGFDGFQAGAANVTCGDFNGFQFGAANIVTKAGTGFQCGAYAQAAELTGCQINLVNVATKICKGFQCGVVNYSGSKGVQLGAVNIMKDGIFPVMIIFNFAF